MAIRSIAASPSKVEPQHGSGLLSGVGALHDVSMCNMGSRKQHSSNYLPSTQQLRSADCHIPCTDNLGSMSKNSVQAAAKAGCNAYASRTGSGAISITSCTPSLKPGEAQEKSTAVESLSYSSQPLPLYRMPVSAAAMVQHAAASTADSSMLHHQHTGLLSGTTSLHTGTNSSWKVPYCFSTPVEKKLQRHLEALKKDPHVRKALEERLEGYRAAEAPVREAREALLEGNKQQAVTLTHEIKLQLVQSGAKQRMERMQQAHQQHKQREKEQLATKITATQRGEAIKQQRLNQEAEREAEQCRIWQAKQWAGVIGSTSYVTQLLTTANNMQQAKARAWEQQAAVVTIQRFWRGYQARNQYNKQQHCVRLLQQAWRRYSSSMAQQDTRTYQAAVRCLRFLMECSGQHSSQLKWASKRVKCIVLRDLRLAKQLDLQRTSHYLLLIQQWTALELKMIALARRRTGADQLTQGTKPMRQSKLVKLAKQKTGVKSMSRRVTAADDEGEDQMPTTAVNMCAALPDGPSPASCRAGDRLLAEDLSPTQLELKARIAKVYLDMKSKAYIAVLGLHWRDKAAWKRSQREQVNLAAAKAILHGADYAQQQSGDALSDKLPSTCPVRPRFRPTAALRELGVLMQQAVAEAPYLDAVITRQNLNNYRAQLEQELDLRKQQCGAAAAFETSAAGGSSAYGRINPPQQQQQQRADSTALSTSDTSQLGLRKLETVAVVRDGIDQPTAGATTVRWDRDRVQACLVRRFALAGCNLTQGLINIPATRPGDWDDMALSELLYSGA